MWQYNGTTIRVGRSWTDDNGITHPSVWNRWTPEFKTSLGMVWVNDPVVESYDDRFYWSANNPKSLDDINVTDEDGNPVLDEDGNQQIQVGLKNQWIAKTKQQSNNLLKDTDWYAVRQVETSQAIPQSVLDYRASVRAASNSIETAINGCTTLDEFIALFTAPTDADGNVTGNAIINQWPSN
jgi:hypothetical protein